MEVLTKRDGAYRFACKLKCMPTGFFSDEAIPVLYKIANSDSRAGRTMTAFTVGGANPGTTPEELSIVMPMRGMKIKIKTSPIGFNIGVSSSPHAYVVKICSNFRIVVEREKQGIYGANV